MNCRICGSTNLELVFDLGLQPWGNNFLKYDQVGKEKFYPLELLFCKNCHLSQLSFTVKKEIMFADHTYLSGMTSSLSNHFKDLAKYVNQKFNKDNLKKTIFEATKEANLDFEEKNKKLFQKTLKELAI